jgi:5-methylcytosine-specific restriction endonuclease McrA
MPGFLLTRSVQFSRGRSNAPLAQVLGVVLDEFIDRHDPSHRRARRVQRKKKALPAPEPSPRGAQAPPVGPPAREHGGRAITAAIRDAVLSDVGGQCEYVSPAGRRCDATAHLQIDHIMPVALGGTSARKNLRVLCGPHNRVEAKRILGNARVQSRRRG